MNYKRLEKLLDAAAGERCEFSGRAIRLDRTECCWIVLAGALDIFFAPLKKDGSTGRKMCAGAEACGPYCIIPGIPLHKAENQQWIATANPLPGSCCIRITLENMRELCARDPEMKLFWEQGIRQWRRSLGEEPEGNSCIGTAFDGDFRTLVNALPEHWRRMWLERRESESGRIEEKLAGKQKIKRKAMEEIAGVLRKKDRFRLPPSTGNCLFDACAAAAEASGIALKMPEKDISGGGEEALEDRIRHLGDFNHIRCREIDLTGEWAEQDVLPFVAFEEGTRKPLAVLGRANDNLRVFDPETGGVRPFSAKEAGSLEKNGWCFYVPFAPGRITLSGLLRMAFRGAGRDAKLLITLMLLGALAGMGVPVINGIIFGTVIPMADRTLLSQLFGISLLLALMQGVFEYVESIALLRIHVRAEYILQSAVWDRLLNLPARFFRDFSSGDLGSRALGVMRIADTLQVSSVKAIIAGAFCFPALFLMLYYDCLLGVISILILLAVLGCFVLIAAAMVRRFTGILAEEGTLNGELVQVFHGITKVRSSGAENSTFARWAERFSRKKRSYRSFAGCLTLARVINAVIPVLTIGVVITIVFWQYYYAKAGTELMPSADFVGFVSALGIVSSMLGQMVMALISSISVIPLYRRLRPVLDVEPENSAAKPPPGRITGEIEVRNVSFRYHANQRWVLSGLSLKVNPGEFIAVVGESGSGKSTLLRLLLGFETPSSGSIAYDGQDVTHVNMQELRSHLGVVLQDSCLLPDTVLRNIIGYSGKLTIEDAWKAARLAGCERDIQEMPMNMHTMLSAGGGSISGGQKQRILIARALAKKPEILLFDEATSALDNAVQAEVSAGIEKLKMTRILIAHRLSTVVNADRIYVLHGGQITESGNYRELMQLNGFFAKLAKRQLAESKEGER